MHALFLCLLFCFSLFADEALIYEIVEEHPDAIEFYEEGKLYLKPDRIRATPQGLFLYSPDDDQWLPIVHMFSDTQGCYIAARSDIMSGSILQPTTIRCTHCSCNYQPSVFNLFKCPNCGLPPY